MAACLFILTAAGGLAADLPFKLDSQTTRLWVSQSLHPTGADMAAFDICVLPAAADLSEARPRTSGQLWLARINPFVAGSAAQMKGAAASEVSVIATAGNPAAPRFDVTSRHWQDFALREIAEPVLATGFDGWVIEGAGEPLGALVKALHAKHPERWIFVRDATVLEGAAVGSLGLYVEKPAAEFPAAEATIAKTVARGLPVLAVSFASAAPEKLAARLALLKAVPFITTADLSGISLAPLKERPRRVLIVYGWNPKEAEKPEVLPVDTMTGELFQTPLEWLGYECDYLNVAKAPLPDEMAARYAAVMLDAELQIPGEKELATAEWLIQTKNAGVPILFTGSVPFSGDDALRIFQESFGLGGTLAARPRAQDPAISISDPEFMHSEAKVAPRINEFRDLQAPAGARVLMSLTAQDTDHPVRYDPVFFASWGGMWLEPYIILRASQDSYLFYADPYKMLAELLSRHGALPAPDVTTKDGCRMFYSHIDGDGFASLTDFRGHPFCGEVVRDKVLKVFPIPVTVSVVEADITAMAEGVEDAWRTRLADTARSIFALPHVKVASHSFSHPYQWDPEDPNPGIYTEANMPLKPAAKYPKVDAEREIRGSIDYINRELAPKDKPVELMLWTGNCRPGELALRMVREMGLENMNGGNTIVSRLYPGIAGVAPRVMQWGAELQINASNQNEFMYANGWNGPFYGGYADVIDTFERTESPRRLKPVNVYYHFYSATCLSSLRALEKVHRWCLDQPLHPVTAHDFALMAKDAYRTHAYDLGQGRWLLANGGRIRTFRLPGDAGRPDMERSRGITGWTVFQGALYVHTNGAPRIELMLKAPQAEPAAPADVRLFMVSSDAEIRFSSLASWTAAFEVDGLVPCTVEFGGLPAKAVCDVTINDAPVKLTTDARGHLSLSLPATARVTLDANHSRYALLH
ncbi:MAG: putative signal peptide protein [Verrucomicrobiaceae bacterium]|nr:putative signal peptide protein [Verrucomicrobiaceae bacterium]